MKASCKHLAFSILALVLGLLSIEATARLVSLLKTRHERAEHLRLLPFDKLGPMDYHGLRNPAAFEDSSQFRRIMSDVLRLRYLQLPSYRILAPGFHYFTLRVNRNGFRGREWHKVKDPREVRIFLLGGSTAFSLYAEEAQTIHSLLEKRLNEKNEHPQRIYRVYNAAMPGATSAAELAIIKDSVRHYSPDWVIDINGFNDASAGATGRLSRPVAFIRKLARSQSIRHIKSFRFVLSRLDQWFSRAMDAETLPGWLAPKPLTPTEIARKYITHMREIRNSLKSTGAQFLVYLQPDLLLLDDQQLDRVCTNIKHFWAEHLPRQYRSHRAAYPAIIRELQCSGLAYINGHALLLQTLQEAPDTMGEITNEEKVSRLGHTIKKLGKQPIPSAIFIDAAHLSPLGNRRVAEQLADYILHPPEIANL